MIRSGLLDQPAKGRKMFVHPQQHRFLYVKREISSKDCRPSMTVLNNIKNIRLTGHIDPNWTYITGLAHSRNQPLVSVVYVRPVGLCCSRPSLTGKKWQ
jgi:hypothetical protein